MRLAAEESPACRATPADNPWPSVCGQYTVPSASCLRCGVWGLTSKVLPLVRAAGVRRYRDSTRLRSCSVHLRDKEPASFWQLAWLSALVPVQQEPEHRIMSQKMLNTFFRGEPMRRVAAFRI